MSGLDLIAQQLLEPFVDPASRTFWGGLLCSLLIAIAFYSVKKPTSLSLKKVWEGLRHPSTGLDIQLYIGRQLIAVLRGTPVIATAWWLATHLALWMDGFFGIANPPRMSTLAVSIVFSLTLFIAWDLSRWVIHWLMHRVPILWEFHQIHHSAEVLSPLTFHRLHPVESLIYQLRGLIVTSTVTAVFFWMYRDLATDVTLLGVPAIGFVFNVVTGNLRHSHVWIRFPAAVERWLLSPAQHQLHHSLDPEVANANLGTWLAVWDRLAGSLLIANTPPTRFGVPSAIRNHGNDLLSAWFGPFRKLSQWASLTIVLLLCAPTTGFADDTSTDETNLSDDNVETDSPTSTSSEPIGHRIIVTDENGTARVAGSAHTIDNTELERFEYNDIERVLAHVPGVSTRTEDGHGLRPNIGIRGANSDRSAKITLMEDGVLLAPAPYAAPAAYYFPMSTRLVGVEVFKGPAATRHGPFTVGGAVNVLTRPIPTHPDHSLDISTGLFRTHKLHGWVGTQAEHIGLLIEGVHLTTDGFKTLDTGESTGFDRTEVMLKTAIEPLFGHQFALKVGYANETSNETYLGLSSGDVEQTPLRRYAASHQDTMRWNRSQAEMMWSVDTDSVQVTTVAYHHWLARAWQKLNRFQSGPDLSQLLKSDPTSGQSAVFLAILRGEEDSTSDNQNLMIGTNDREFHSFGVQTVARWYAPMKIGSSTIEGGLRLHGDYVSRLHTEDPYAMITGQLQPVGTTTLTTLDSVDTARAIAAHVQQDLQIGPIHMLPSGRVEWIRTTHQQVNVDVGTQNEAIEPLDRTIALPGLGLLAEVTAAAHLFAGVHRGFSPVSPGQPVEVDPETSWNYEAGIRRHEQASLIELVGYFNDYTNITGQCTLSGGCSSDQIDQQFNGGAAWVYGLEAVASDVFETPTAFSFPISATYTLTHSEFQTGFISNFPQFGQVTIGDSLPYLPQHQFSAQLAVSHPRFDIGMGLTGRSGMLDQAGVFPIQETDVPSLVLVDAASAVQITPRASVYVNATNITQSDAVASWRPFGARPTAPFQIMIGLKVTPQEATTTP